MFTDLRSGIKKEYIDQNHIIVIIISKFIKIFKIYNMLQGSRKEKIISILNKKKEIKIDTLCSIFNVSLATIHRDLNELEREGRVKKIHGGVLLNVIKDIETRNMVRLRTNVKQKKEIAKKAMEFIHNHDCIFLDNSTTCYYLAESLSVSDFQNLLIITNSYMIPRLFVKNNRINIVSTGGLFIKELGCFTGSSTINTINDFNGNKFFFSTAAISLKGDLSDIHRPESDEVKRGMQKKSRESICLLDATKFNMIAQSKVLSISEVHKIITDNDLPVNIRAEFAKIGKKLIIS